MGVVEKAIQYVARSWWRTAPVSSLGQAQADLDRWAVAVSDQRKRAATTIVEIAGQEALLGLPAVAFPAQLQVERVVRRSALVAFDAVFVSQDTHEEAVPAGVPAARERAVRAQVGGGRRHSRLRRPLHRCRAMLYEMARAKQLADDYVPLPERARDWVGTVESQILGIGDDDTPSSAVKRCLVPSCARRWPTKCCER